MEEKEEMVVAFSWVIHDLPASLATLTEERPLTSGDMKSNGCTWRAVFTANLDLFLQLVSAALDKVRGGCEALALEFLLMQLDST